MCTIGPIKAIWCKSYSRPCEGVIARKRWRGRPIPRFLLQRASRVAIPAEIDANYIKAFQGNRYPSLLGFLSMFRRFAREHQTFDVSTSHPKRHVRTCLSLPQALCPILFSPARFLQPVIDKPHVSPYSGHLPKQRSQERTAKRLTERIMSMVWPCAALFFLEVLATCMQGGKHQKHQKPRGIVISVDTIIVCTEKQTGTIRGSLLKPIGSPPKISLRLPGGPVGHFLFTTPGETRAC